MNNTLDSVSSLDIKAGERGGGGGASGMTFGFGRYVPTGGKWDPKLEILSINDQLGVLEQ